METTRVIFNTTPSIKKAAQKRAREEGTDLTSTLNQAMLLYAEGVFDPDDFLTREDVLAIRRAEADVKAGRVHTLSEVRSNLGLT
jgi:hypothetical protein